MDLPSLAEVDIMECPSLAIVDIMDLPSLAVVHYDIVIEVLTCMDLKTFASCNLD